MLLALIVAPSLRILCADPAHICVPRAKPAVPAEEVAREVAVNLISVVLAELRCAAESGAPTLYVMAFSDGLGDKIPTARRRGGFASVYLLNRLKVGLAVDRNARFSPTIRRRRRSTVGIGVGRH